MATQVTARIPCTPRTRDKIRSLRRDGEAYENVLLRLYTEHGDSADEACESR